MHCPTLQTSQPPFPPSVTGPEHPSVPRLRRLPHRTSPALPRALHPSHVTFPHLPLSQRRALGKLHPPPPSPLPPPPGSQQPSQTENPDSSLLDPMGVPCPARICAHTQRITPSHRWETLRHPSSSSFAIDCPGVTPLRTPAVRLSAPFPLCPTGAERVCPQT